MTAGQTGGTGYDARIARAEFLISRYPFAIEPLRFFATLSKFQRDVLAKIPETWAGQPVVMPEKRVRSELNLVLLLPHFPAFLALVKQHAPGPLAAAADSLSRENSSAWIAALGDYWALGGRESQARDPRQEFLSRAFLQPYAEFAAVRTQAPPRMTLLPTCPLCEAKPVAGVLRPEGDGGKRFLLCSFCSREWEFRRILCPACGEEAEDKLPVYVAEDTPHVRVEACDTCKFYLRTIDLTKDGRAVPLVDDLAAIPHTLWAHEQGYSRLQPNLLGT